MSMKAKLVEHVKKFGYSYKGLVLSTLAFPPAAFYLAWSWPGKKLPERIALCAGSFIVSIGIALLIPVTVVGALALLYNRLFGGG